MSQNRWEVRLLAACSFLSFAFLAPAAAAQGTARSMDIDGSAISSAMGGASAAVFWSAEPNYWANPALLGYYQGVRYQYARSQLVPGLAEDVFLTSDRVTLAAYGVGLEVGRTKLDYGPSTWIDEYGHVLGEFEAYEEVGAITVGLSVSGLVRSIAPGSPVAALARNLDLAVGFARKDVEMKLHPGMFAEASGNPYDIGLLARGGLDLGVLGGAAVPARLDAGFGLSVLNFNDVEFTFLNEDAAWPPSRMRRLGGSVRLAVGQPAAWAATGGRGFPGVLLRGLDPLVSLGLAYDDEHVQAGDWSAYGYDVTHVGGELTCLNVLSLRVGHVTDRTGDIEGTTWGVGVGLPIAGVAGVRYDYARYPQSSSLPDVKRHTASVFVDSIALWRLRR
jgi:hypothetical protein